MAAAGREGGSSGSGGQASGEGGAAGGGGAAIAAAGSRGAVGGGSEGTARAAVAVAPGAGGGAGVSTARSPEPERGSPEWLRIAYGGIANSATEAIENVSDRLTQTARTAPPAPATMAFVAGHADEVLTQLSPRNLEFCSVDALASQMRHLAPPSGDGEELKAVLSQVLTVRVVAQRQEGLVNIIRGQSVRKTSAGDQHTPDTPEVMADYLRQVSKPALSPKGKAESEAYVRAVRSAEVESARLQTERHAGAPFRDNSNDQSSGVLRGTWAGSTPCS